MEFGLLVDCTSATSSGSERALEWVRGSPDKSWLTEAFKAPPGGRMQVATMRCMTCGYVELYAMPEWARPAAWQ
jgi:hypothetical protein